MESLASKGDQPMSLIQTFNVDLCSFALIAAIEMAVIFLNRKGRRAAKSICHEFPLRKIDSNLGSGASLSHFLTTNSTGLDSLTALTGTSLLLAILPTVKSGALGFWSFLNERISLEPLDQLIRNFLRCLSSLTAWDSMHFFSWTADSLEARSGHPRNRGRTQPVLAVIFHQQMWQTGGRLFVF